MILLDLNLVDKFAKDKTIQLVLYNVNVFYMIYDYSSIIIVWTANIKHDHDILCRKHKYEG